MKYDPKKAKRLLKEAGYPHDYETVGWIQYLVLCKVYSFYQQHFAVALRLLEALESGPELLSSLSTNLVARC